MKTVFNEELECYFHQPETPLEAVESLEKFFEADMWYAKGAEWKTEVDMLKYLKIHFDICKKEIKNMEDEEVGKVQCKTSQKKEKKKEGNNS